jgi:molybdate transport system substrate-binding protein
MSDSWRFSFVHLALSAVGVLGVLGAPARCTAGETVSVFAAASLSEAFTELGARLERRTSPLHATFNFAGSQQLAAQIEQGAPADVFASADPQWMAYVQEHGLLAEAPRDFARNHLTIVVPKTNPGHIEQLQDLARPGVKLVLGAEAVPVGRYSRAALGKLSAAPGFGSDYADRVLRNIVSNEENVKGVVAKVQLGEADAGIVYRSDVTPKVAEKVRTLDIPEAYNVIATYPVAIVAGAANPAAAATFVKVLLSPEGQAVLRMHGFTPVTGQ